MSSAPRVRETADLSIGDLAARFGLATHVLRHWEDMGLLAPHRDPAGRRRYREADVETATLILVAKGIGLSLDEIRTLFIAAPDRGARRELLRAHQARLQEQIAQAQAALTALGHAMDCGAADMRTCPNFRDLLARALPLVGDPEQRSGPLLRALTSHEPGN
ncbi:MerR family transcriptional regulator [Nocardia mexicana]|uniref:DNA-binding transcriptional MerR regulator n=1 Tax=Nocardia mexicana TaxID=279262 RepID=A0A370GS97_9NOCA|nr:MerR family transcriptional regulator [Nocardia mexicana]RDI46299.1 DNA-binding transcriptional MerR regulator [Nocardia mexicana]